MRLPEIQGVPFDRAQGSSPQRDRLHPDAAPLRDGDGLPRSGFRAPQFPTHPYLSPGVQGRLDEAALKAAQNTQFTPAKQLGRNIDSTTELSFTFRLTDD